MSVPYRYSYSGADARGYIYYPGLEDKILELESLHTVSVSVHEAKGPARALGYKNVKGFAKSQRTIAGSIIMTVIEDHPLRGLLNLTSEMTMVQPNAFGGWSLDNQMYGIGSALENFNYTNRLITTLPRFNLLMTYVSEASSFSKKDVFSEDIRFGGGGISDPVGSEPEQNLIGSAYDIPGASDLIEGIEIITTGKVTSVSDVVTEITFSFVALDYKPLAGNSFGSAIEPIVNQDLEKERYLIQRLFPVRTSEEKATHRFERDVNKSREEVIKAGVAAGRSMEEIQSDLRYMGLQ